MDVISNPKMIEEQQGLFLTIRKQKENLNGFEASQNYDLANRMVEEIISSLNNFLTKYSSDINKDNNTQLRFTALISSYESKKKTYEYLTFIQEKKKTIVQVRTENIFKARRKTSSNDIDENEAKLEEANDYVYIPKDSINDNIKDTIELCDVILSELNAFDINRFKVIQDESFDIITQKSFFIDNTFMPENHRNVIKSLRNKLESLYIQEKTIDNIADRVKQLNDVIRLVKEEYRRRFNKYKLLKTLLKDDKKKSSK
jgi:hypothetical protein